MINNKLAYGGGDFSSNSSRNQGIDAARCVANYLIILLHASAVDQYCNQQTAEATFWNFIYDCICPVALPVLFMISGYLLFKNFSISTYATKMKRRIGRLAVPYVAWNIFFVLFFVAGSMAVPRLAARVTTFDLFSLQGAVSKVISFTVHPIDGPLWFLRTLFVFSLLSPIMALFLKNKYLSVAFIAIVFGAGLWLASVDLSRYLTMTYPIYALLMFFVGGMMSNTKHSPTDYFTNGKIFIFAMLALAVTAIIKVTCAGAVVTEACSILLYFLGAIVFFNAISYINIEKLSKSKIYNGLREMSFFAYAGHFLFCSMLLHTVAPYLSFMGAGKQTLLTLLFCFGGTFIMWVIYFGVRKLCPSILKPFDGTL